MELRYCEECGDVIRLDSDEPASLHDHFICDKCKDAAANGDTDPNPSPPPRPARVTGSGEFSAEELDLFSSQSIALRKREADPNGDELPEARLRLVKATKPTRPPAPKPASGGQQAGFRPQAKTEGLGTPPPRPVARRTPPPALERPQPLAPAAATATTEPTEPKTSTQSQPKGKEVSGRPAKSARKIIFRCLHCKSPISIRPVEKTSKLICPSCDGAVYVTPTGRLLKKNPSHAVRKAETEPPNLEKTMHDGLPRQKPKIDTATRERLSAFEEHIFSQDPDKTAFLTEEKTRRRQEEEDSLPLANELLSTVVRAREQWTIEETVQEAIEPEPYEDEVEAAPVSDDEEWPEEDVDEENEADIEEWPGESDLLAEDEFDENLRSPRQRSGRPKPSAIRVLLVGSGLLLPFVVVMGLYVSELSTSRSRGTALSPPQLTVLEKLGSVARRGLLTIFGEVDETETLEDAQPR